MKHNLKNRPKWKSPPPEDTAVKYFIPAYEEWFEGFEKELREHLQAFIDEHAWPECSEFSVEKTVKEILGE